MCLCKAFTLPITPGSHCGHSQGYQGSPRKQCYKLLYATKQPTGRRSLLLTVTPGGGVSSDTHLRTHAAWVHTIETNTVHGRANAPNFHSLCLPRAILQCTGRYRLGGHHLYARLHGDGREHRQACPLCSNGRLRADWHGTIVSRCGGTCLKTYCTLCGSARLTTTLGTTTLQSLPLAVQDQHSSACSLCLAQPTNHSWLGA